MATGLNTKEKLLEEACNQFWSKGYSNVALRDIAGAAGVDVALVARYYGSKRGLFMATLDRVDSIDPAQFDTVDALVDAIVHLFVTTPRDSGAPSALGLILLNANDPEVGPDIRQAYQRKWQDAFDRIIGDPHRAGLFSAALLGMCVAEKALTLPGIAPPQSAAFEAQLRTLLNAALTHPVDMPKT